MIKAKTNRIGCDVQIGGEQTTILAELTYIIKALLERNILNEEMLDVITGLAKAEVNGNVSEYMRKTLKDKVLNKINQIKDEIDKKENEENKEVKEDLNDIMDKIKELLEEDED